MSPVNIVMLGVLIFSSVSVVLYSKIMGKDETQIEKILEEMIEKNAEKALNLPDGSLDNTLDEIEKVVESKDEKNN